jgi:hypothetical protein
MCQVARLGWGDGPVETRQSCVCISHLFGCRGSYIHQLHVVSCRSLLCSSRSHILPECVLLQLAFKQVYLGQEICIISWAGDSCLVASGGRRGNGLHLHSVPVRNLLYSSRWTRTALRCIRSDGAGGSCLATEGSKSFAVLWVRVWKVAKDNTIILPLNVYQCLRLRVSGPM